MIYNATTKHPYSAKNAELLAQAMEQKGWQTGEFAGFKQWMLRLDGDADRERTRQLKFSGFWAEEMSMRPIGLGQPFHCS